MSYVNSSIAAYRQQSVAGASSVQLVVMLYDKAIGHCQKAMQAIDGGELEVQHECLTKAQRILSELSGSLDLEKGADIAENLMSLYNFSLTRLTEANVENSSTKIREVIRVLSELRDAWAAIAAGEIEEHAGDES